MLFARSRNFFFKYLLIDFVHRSKIRIVLYCTFFSIFFFFCFSFNVIKFNMIIIRYKNFNYRFNYKFYLQCHLYFFLFSFLLSNMTKL